MQIRPKLLLYAEMAGAFTAISAFIGGVLLFFSADLPPWAAQTRAQAIDKKVEDQAIAAKQSIEEVKRDQSVMTRALLRLDRTYWEKQLEDAEKDLAANPTSAAAKKAKREAEAQIAYIDEQLKPSGDPLRGPL